MVVRKSVPSLAYFTAEWAWDGPAHVHLDMPPHLILLLHHLLTLETLGDIASDLYRLSCLDI